MICPYCKAEINDKSVKHHYICCFCNGVIDQDLKEEVQKQIADNNIKSEEIAISNKQRSNAFKEKQQCINQHIDYRNSNSKAINICVFIISLPVIGLILLPLFTNCPPAFSIIPFSVLAFCLYALYDTKRMIKRLQTGTWANAWIFTPGGQTKRKPHMTAIQTHVNNEHVSFICVSDFCNHKNKSPRITTMTAQKSDIQQIKNNRGEYHFSIKDGKKSKIVTMPMFDNTKWFCYVFGTNPNQVV